PVHQALQLALQYHVWETRAADVRTMSYGIMIRWGSSMSMDKESRHVRTGERASSTSARSPRPGSAPMTSRLHAPGAGAVQRHEVAAPACAPTRSAAATAWNEQAMVDAALRGVNLPKQKRTETSGP